MYDFFPFGFLIYFILILSQEYTNTDNPFGDAHLLESFVWQKVLLMLNILKIQCFKKLSTYIYVATCNINMQLFERQEIIRTYIGPNINLNVLFLYSSLAIK